MIPSARASQRLVGGLAGAALLLAVSGCTASASPSATSSGEPSESSAPSATPQASPSAYSTPDQGAAPAWTETGSTGEYRERYTVTLLPDGMVLVVGGQAGGVSVLASAELYDPGSGN